jgi:hypothetical protein
VGALPYIAGVAITLVGLGSIVAISSTLAGRLIPALTGPPRGVGEAGIGAAVALAAALLLGSFGLLHVWLYVPVLVLVALALRRWGSRIPSEVGTALESGAASGQVRGPAEGERPAFWLSAAGFAVAAIVIALFAVETWQKLGTGMTGFDSTWYHGPFAAGFAASGDTLSLHFVAPQFLSWFYPQNSELFHGLGILAFGNDLLSPLINLGWLAGCLLAAWAIGRPYGGAPISLAGVALVLGSAVMADQAGEARNDIVGLFFVLAGLAVMINSASGSRRLSAGPLLVVALAAGLAAGTKINFIPAAIALAAGAVWLSGSGQRRRASVIALAGLAVTGGYWYLRNLIQSGNPLPWIDRIGLPSPDQDLGGRDAASVLSYLTDPGVVRDWFFPGLADGFGQGWPLLLALALAGVVLCFWRGSDPVRRIGAFVALALALAWIAAPTSASGPTGTPEGFVSGLRYLAPALAVALAMLGAVVGRRDSLVRWTTMGALLLLTPFVVFAGRSWGLFEILVAGLLSAALFAMLLTLLVPRIRGGVATTLRSRFGRSIAAVALATVVIVGYGVQSRYFDNRYASPEFTTAGLSEAFVWARGVEGESIGTNATRQYPLFGTELDNEVQYLGVPGPHGGFVKTDSCQQFRDAVARGDYRYLVLALDRENPERPFPREIPWIEKDPNAVEVARTSPTVIYELTGPLDPATCP